MTLECFGGNDYCAGKKKTTNSCKNIHPTARMLLICVCKGGETKTCNFSTYISHLKIVITLTCVLMLGPNALPVFVLCYFASCFCHCGGFYR